MKTTAFARAALLAAVTITLVACGSNAGPDTDGGPGPGPGTTTGDGLVGRHVATAANGAALPTVVSGHTICGAAIELKADSSALTSIKLNSCSGTDSAFASTRWRVVNGRMYFWTFLSTGPDPSDTGSAVHDGSFGQHLAIFPSPSSPSGAYAVDFQFATRQ